MENEFKKLLKYQFGAKNYANFVKNMKEGMKQTPVEHNGVYLEIYFLLRSFKAGYLVCRHQQLEQTMLDVLRICRTYIYAVSLYIVAVALLLFLGTVPILTYAGIGILTLFFGFKTGEFVINKYCYVDARIVITYKSVLERLLVEAVEKEREKR